MIFSLVAACLWTVMTRSLLRSAIGLALSSVILSIVMFRFNSPLAAVFELSVCAGLISVLFVSTISLTHPLTKQEVLQHMRERLARFWFLPLLVIILGIILSLVKLSPAIRLPAEESVKDVRVVLWDLRQIDILGQVIVLLTGVFGVVILFKERLKK
ncbi:MAG: NADH-quinone oxidoreductase subunit J [Candidatus Omnitrophica bacterium]|nr:NADH-quinone oxidoreductase subunit J [Candidatus Omnitrophota bacterium]